MQGVQAEQLAGDRELGGVLDKALVHFDHAERGPLLAQSWRLPGLRSGQRPQDKQIEHQRESRRPAVDTRRVAASRPRRACGGAGETLESRPLGSSPVALAIVLLFVVGVAQTPKASLDPF